MKSEGEHPEISGKSGKSAKYEKCEKSEINLDVTCYILSRFITRNMNGGLYFRVYPQLLLDFRFRN